jgi:hypothetical protein
MSDAFAAVRTTTFAHPKSHSFTCAELLCVRYCTDGLATGGVAPKKW